MALVDGEWRDLADGYPLLGTQGSSQVVTWRIPRFDDKGVQSMYLEGGWASGLNAAPANARGSSTTALAASATCAATAAAVA